MMMGALTDFSAYFSNSWIKASVMVVPWRRETLGPQLLQDLLNRRETRGNAPGDLSINNCNFGLLVVGVVSFVAGFNRHRAARTVASVVILIAAGMFASLGDVPEVALGLGLPGLGLFILNSVRL